MRAIDQNTQVPAGQPGVVPVDGTLVAPRDLLDPLRAAALSHRVSARVDVFSTCAALLSAPSQSNSPCLEPLVRCLQEAMGTNLRFLRVGEAEVSFDEAWLLRALDAVRRDDPDTLALLVHRRIPAEHRHNIRFLLARAVQNTV